MPASPTVQLDPQHPVTIGTRAINIPDPTHKLHTLVEARESEYHEEEYDDEDTALFKSSDERPRTAPPPSVPQEDDWEHDADWVRDCVQHMLPAPEDASPMATSALQRELKAMLNDQESARSLKELGWYMPPDFIGDNLFQWVVELHSFEPDLPIAKDMASQCVRSRSHVVRILKRPVIYRGVNSLVFEIRFPAAFPHSPPFFRILKPRFLPFIHGGGGHVTGGMSHSLLMNRS